MVNVRVNGAAFHPRSLAILTLLVQTLDDQNLQALAPQIRGRLFEEGRGLIRKSEPDQWRLTEWGERTALDLIALAMQPWWNDETKTRAIMNALSAARVELEDDEESAA